MQKKELLSLLICMTLVLSTVLIPITNIKGLSVKSDNYCNITDPTGGTHSGTITIRAESYPKGKAVNGDIIDCDLHHNYFDTNRMEFELVDSYGDEGIFEFEWNTQYGQYSLPDGQYSIEVANTLSPASTRIVNIDNPGNDRPSTPSKPSGPTILYKDTNYDFTIPDGDSPLYGWDWDSDLNIDEYSSEPSITKAFHTTGTFEVQVMAFNDVGGGYDNHGAHSTWSNKHQYTVTQESDIDPSVVTSDSEITIEADLSADKDGDGVANVYDNCPCHWNADQEDSDNDGIGDVCEGSDPDDCNAYVGARGWFMFWLNPEITDDSTVTVEVESEDDNVVFIEEICNPPNGGCTSSDTVSFTNEDEQYRATVVGKHLTSSPVKINLNVISQDGNDYLSTFIYVNVVEPGSGPGPGPGPDPDPDEWDGCGAFSVDAGGPYYVEEKSLPVAFDGSYYINPKYPCNLVFKWDFESDGTWDTSWSDSPVAAYVYPEEGLYTATLWGRATKQNPSNEPWVGRRDTAKVIVGEEYQEDPVSDGISIEITEFSEVVDQDGTVERPYYKWKMDFHGINTNDPDGGSVNVKWLYEPTEKYFENGEFKSNSCVYNSETQFPRWISRHTGIDFGYYKDCVGEDGSVYFDVWMKITDDEGKQVKIHQRFDLLKDYNYETRSVHSNPMDVKAYVSNEGNFVKAKNKAEHGSTNRFRIVITHTGEETGNTMADCMPEDGLIDTQQELDQFLDKAKKLQGTLYTEPWIPNINVLLSDNIKNVKPEGLTAKIIRKDGSIEEFSHSEVIDGSFYFNGEYQMKSIKQPSLDRFYDPLLYLDGEEYLSYFESGEIAPELKSAIIGKGISLHNAELKRPSEIWPKGEDDADSAYEGLWVLIDYDNSYPPDEKWYLFDCNVHCVGSQCNNWLRLFDLSLPNCYDVELPEMGQIYPDTNFRFSFGHYLSTDDHGEEYKIGPGDQFYLEFEAVADSIFNGEYLDWVEVCGTPLEPEKVPYWVPLDVNGDIALNGGIQVDANAIGGFGTLAGIIIPKPKHNAEPIPVYEEINAEYGQFDIDNLPWFVEPTDKSYKNIDFVDNPVINNPIDDDPVIDDPVLDDPVIDDPVLDDPVIDGSDEMSTLGNINTVGEPIGIDVWAAITWSAADTDHAGLNIFPPFDIESKVWDPSVQSYVDSGPKFFVGDKVKFKCTISDQDVGPVSCFESGLFLNDYLPPNLAYIETNKVEIQDIKTVEPVTMELNDDDYIVSEDNNQITWVINKGFEVRSESSSGAVEAGSYPPGKVTERFAGVTIEFEAKVISGEYGEGEHVFSTPDYIANKNTFLLNTFSHHYNIGEYYNHYSSDKPVYDSSTFLIYKEEGDTPPDDDSDGSDGSDDSDHKNIPPVAGDDNARTVRNKPVLIHVTENDDDPDNSNGGIDPRTIEFTQPEHGTVRVPNNEPNTPIIEGILEYTPDGGYVGQDSFTYTIKDRLGAVSNVATVMISVINDDPDNPDDPDDPDNPDGIDVAIIKPIEGYLYINDKQFLPLSSTWVIGKITITAAVVDPTESVTDVKFYVDETEIGSLEFVSSEDTYELVLDERTIGLRTLSVVPFINDQPVEESAAEIDVKAIIL